MSQSEANAEHQTATNPRGQIDEDGRRRMVPGSDVAPGDAEARATSQNAGMPGTQPAEFLAGEGPGDREPPPATPEVAREAGSRQPDAQGA